MLNSSYSWKVSPNRCCRSDFNASFLIGFGNGLNRLYIYGRLGPLDPSLRFERPRPPDATSSGCCVPRGPGRLRPGAGVPTGASAAQAAVGAVAGPDPCCAGGWLSGSSKSLSCRCLRASLRVRTVICKKKGAHSIISESTIMCACSYWHDTNDMMIPANTCIY